MIESTNEKKRTCIVDFPVSADYRVKIEENEKRNKYFDLARELRKLLSMKVTVIPIVFCVLGTVPKSLERELEELEIGGRIEILQATALLRAVRRLRRVLETWGDLLSLQLQWKTITYRWCEKLAKSMVFVTASHHTGLDTRSKARRPIKVG